MKNKTADAVVVKNIRKEFVLPQYRNRSIKQAFINVFRKPTPVKQKAINGVSFSIKKGEFFGIIGRNGSGKSTLLKLLAGIYHPTSGAIDIRGGLTPFIELGVGFNPELSGRDNVFLNGALLGFTHRQMDDMYNGIVEFAELEEFMDQKLKNYSSGMQVRLAFSIAIMAKNDILIFDEVLAVGDENFQKKCIETFEELKRSGSTIIFVSHSMGQVRQFCDRVAVISEGKVLFIGDTETAIDKYHRLNDEAGEKEVNNDSQNKTLIEQHLGSGRATIEKYKLFGEKGEEIKNLTSREKFTISVWTRFNEDVNNPVLGVMFRKNPQENLYGINTYYEEFSIGLAKEGDILRINFSDRLPIAAGNYYLTLVMSDARSATEYEDLDMLNNFAKVKVKSREEDWGQIVNSATITKEKL